MKTHWETFLLLLCGDFHNLFASSGSGEFGKFFRKNKSIRTFAILSFFFGQVVKFCHKKGTQVTTVL